MPKTIVRSSSAARARARAMTSAKEHRAGVKAVARLFSLAPAVLRRELNSYVNTIASAGAITAAEHEVLNRIVELLTLGRAGDKTVEELRKIDRALRKDPRSSPVAIVVAGIAQDSVDLLQPLISRPTLRRRTAGTAAATPRYFITPGAVLWADVGGALAAGAWCLVNGKSREFTVDEMITGAIYMSAAALGMLTQ
jgi:hypothetical protein